MTPVAQDDQVRPAVETPGYPVRSSLFLLRLPAPQVKRPGAGWSRRNVGINGVKMRS